MTGTEVFTESLPDVTLRRSRQQDGVWQNDDPEVDVVAMKCRRDPASKAEGFPQSGYVMRARHGYYDDLADIWWVRSSRQPRPPRACVLGDRDEEPTDHARLMLICLNDDCAYGGGGMIAHRWVEAEADWACPKCGVIA